MAAARLLAIFTISIARFFRWKTWLKIKADVICNDSHFWWQIDFFFCYLAGHWSSWKISFKPQLTIEHLPFSPDCQPSFVLDVHQTRRKLSCGIYRTLVLQLIVVFSKRRYTINVSQKIWKFNKVVYTMRTERKRLMICRIWCFFYNVLEIQGSKHFLP